ncbi:DNA polymerase [uncultured Methanolobus sp.]|uniref:DNA polymerase n=1 Tax=uncultured Methanolobus sp. TaxID=218300 RepID=UPI002AAC3E99|nr:DNA polymerase [uncultured Methanolobus sp.]
MGKIAVRGYTVKVKNQQYNPFYNNNLQLRYDRVFVFDTETTIDQYQNMKVGFFQTYQDGYIQHEGLFYDPQMLNEGETKTLLNYAKEQDIELYLCEEFVDDVFYPEVFGLKTLCVGFNLAFDISRLAKFGNNSKVKNRGGFTFTLSDNRFKPPIVIKKLGGSNSFKFTTTKYNIGDDYFSGHFLDAQTLGKVLLQDDKLSLEKACELLDTRHKKMKDIKHGTVTKMYLDYLIRDVESTFDVYGGLIKELDLYNIDVPPTKIFSSASLGKYALKQLGLKPLSEQNYDFPDNMKGQIMTSYYGGRCECRNRKVPTKVTTLDFTSMYPTVTMVMGLWNLMIADYIETEIVTEEIRELLEIVNLEYLQKEDNWKDFVVMVKLRPDGDILPVRMDYKEDNGSFNVGVNYLSSSHELWYALPDVIASVILTGKAPEIIEAVRFIPVGVQEGLRESQILGIDIDPEKDNLVQVLVEERQKIKIEMKGIDPESPEYQQLKSRAQAIKILVNAMSYGIFIELNPEDRKSDIEVYGLDSFSTSENRYEKPGNFYHPLLAVMITSGSKLFLAMAEAKVEELGTAHAYMDTDSIFVPPEYAEEITEYFQPLNPYNLDIPLLKPEKVDYWFYGISSKRYPLYRFNGNKIMFKDYKLHGLGHLTNPFSKDGKGDWHEEIWNDLLQLHYGLISSRDIVEKYSNMYAISKLSVSTPNVWNRFKKLNKSKPWKEMIKPFNFCLVGFQAVEEDGRAIKPLAPFCDNPQKIVHEPFIDYEAGEIMQGSHYFKSLSKTILQYAEHPEHKFEGDIGLLERRHIHADGILYIGKEANNIDEEELELQRAQTFIDEEGIKQWILSMTPKEAREYGVMERSTLKRMKDRILSGEKFNFWTKEVRKLVSVF